jgi:hypothetical protein
MGVPYCVVGLFESLGCVSVWQSGCCQSKQFRVECSACGLAHSVMTNRLYSQHLVLRCNAAYASLLASTSHLPRPSLSHLYDTTYTCRMCVCCTLMHTCQQQQQGSCDRSCNLEAPPSFSLVCMLCVGVAGCHGGLVAVFSGAFRCTGTKRRPCRQGLTLYLRNVLSSRCLFLLFERGLHLYDSTVGRCVRMLATCMLPNSKPCS